MTRKYKMTIAYDGTHYGGWQRQPNAISIQEKIENALSIILHKTVPLIGSGRTDAGVHALGQVAHFSFDRECNLDRLKTSLNGILDRDIRIKELREVSEEFHARFSALSKIYHYHLHLDPVQNPFQRLYTTHIPFPIDLSLLREGASFFIGTHDFTSFAGKCDQGSAVTSPIKTLFKVDLIEKEGGLTFVFEGTGFLYKMVRNIVGTLLAIASHKIPLKSLKEIFNKKERSAAGPTAPSKGLFLMSVEYPDLFN